MALQRWHISGWCVVAKPVQKEETWTVAAKPKTTAKGKTAAWMKAEQWNKWKRTERLLLKENPARWRWVDLVMSPIDEAGRSLWRFLGAPILGTPQIPITRVWEWWHLMGTRNEDAQSRSRKTMTISTYLNKWSIDSWAFCSPGVWLRTHGSYWHQIPCEAWEVEAVFFKMFFWQGPG